MSDTLVQDPQSGDDPVQTANPDGVDEQTQSAPQQPDQDDSQQDQGEAKELPKFHYQFSKELQGHEALRDMQKPDDLANAYLELKEKVDNGSTGEDASVESAENYDFTGIEYPQDFVTEEDVNSVKELAYDLGLSQEKASKLFESIVKDAQSVMESNKQKQEEAQQQHEETLKKEFGDSFKEKITQAHRAYETLGSKELGDLLDSHGLGSHPDVVKAFLNIHEKIGEDSLVEGEGTGNKRNIEEEWFPNSSKAW